MNRITLLVVFLCISTVYSYGCWNDPVRHFDGLCNNRIFKRRGAAGTTYKRGRVGFEHVDPLNPLANTDWQARGIPAPRYISNQISTQSGDIPDETGLNAFSIFFGQFVAHDLTEADFRLGPDFDPERGCGATTSQEDQFCRGNTATLPGLLINQSQDTGALAAALYIPMTDSRFVVKKGVKESVNINSHLLDLSQVYGSEDIVNEGLRLFEGGKLKFESHFISSPFGPPRAVSNYLPKLNNTNTPTKLADIKIAASREDRFASGDTRTNENAVLMGHHMIWAREHNRKATEIQAAHPDWSDEDIFQEARRFTVAVYQHIVMDEWLPLLLGSQFELVKEHRQFRDFSSPSPQLDQVFVSAAFRLHSGIVNLINPQNECYESFIQCPPGLPPQNCLEFFPFAGQSGGPFTPERLLQVYGTDSPLRGAYNQKAQKLDEKVTNALRDLHPGGAGGVDVLAININRARLHGVPNYDRIRKRTVGIKSVYRYEDCPYDVQFDENTEDPIECFLHITADTAKAQKLKDVYGKVNRVDAWIGFFSEDHVEGSPMGRTVAVRIARQFSKLRNGDRFWWENRHMFTEAEREIVSGTKAADVYNRNSGLQITDAFVFPTAVVKPDTCA